MAGNGKFTVISVIGGPMLYLNAARTIRKGLYQREKIDFPIFINELEGRNELRSKTNSAYNHAVCGPVDAQKDTFLRSLSEFTTIYAIMDPENPSNTIRKGMHVQFINSPMILKPVQEIAEIRATLGD